MIILDLVDPGVNNIKYNLDIVFLIIFLCIIVSIVSIEVIKLINKKKKK